MNYTEAVDLYSGFAEPLLSFPVIVALLLVALPAAAFVGFHLGNVEYRRRGYNKVPAEQVPGGTSLGAMLALLGLLLGFAFSSALGWREARQSTLVDEAMAISTAFLTADLLDDPGRTELQTRIVTYAQTRLATRDDIATREAWTDFLSRTFAAQAEIWPATRRAMDAEISDPVRTAVARSVTDMLDAHTQRIAAAAEQIPPPAKLMIVLVAVFAILIVGNRSALQGRPLTWRTFVFAAVLSVVMIVIYDLDRTLEGTMRVNPDTLRATIHDLETSLAVRGG
ncbi:hypothetical protein AVO45_10315 [Ruegeria marisrubri]|uniref:DUF4239 domain-containing protein n=1 Tax=Ruegeria marisrubri TaxID=1685379 RepID=A0A0X3TMA2_9RHOB|nr:hypothetical protein [Ruegeria marisrubri]KUJ76878.1 hypothetical protein AVO45_10315 [Ruegeria marisrubri]